MLIQKILGVHVHFKLSHRCYASLKILYFGTDKFSLPSLQRLCNEKLSRLEVVTSFKAHNSPVKNFAESKSIAVHDWAVLSKEDNFRICEDFDLGLVVSFGHLIPEHIISCFKNGMLNVHGSLLPKYRGASPIIYAIRNGDPETGVSIMRVRPKKFDVGEILANRRLLIPDDILMPQLHDQLASLGADLLVECIGDLNRFKPIEQDHSMASYAPKITNEFCEVRWSEMSSIEIFNLYRSTYSFKPPTTSFKKEPVKLFELMKPKDFQPVPDLKNERTGCFKFCKKTRSLYVKCVDENFLEIKQLSIGKKRVMSAADFNNGFLKNCHEKEMFFHSNK